MDPKQKEAAHWIEEVTGTRIDDFHEDLKSGVVLCELVNKVKPGTIPKINKNRMPFMQMENIKAYTDATKQLGVPDHYNFVTVDLFEGKDLNQVALNVINFKRVSGHGTNTRATGAALKELVKISPGDDQSVESGGAALTFSETPQDAVVAGGDVSRIGQAKLAGHAQVADSKLAPICKSCGLAVSAGVINAVNCTFHPKCFVCKKCGVQLARTKFYEHDGKAYCERCILVVNPQTNVRGVTRNMGFDFNKGENTE